MSSAYGDILRSLSRPLEAIPTGKDPLLVKLAGIKAVLFDLYGTLFISGSGDVGTSRQAACEAALAGALEAVGAGASGPVGEGVDCLFRAIEGSHAESRVRGIDCPEVDIVEIWRQVVAELGRRGVVSQSTWTGEELCRLAVEYEGRVNPVWPMPGLRECLVGLAEKRLLLGIISNAQFYSRELFDGLLGQPAEQWGFDPDLQYYSYQHGRAKPGLELHQMAAEALEKRQIRPPNVLYVGNDMLNDVFPATRLGFRAALFAGDARSLQLRGGDPRIEGVTPDLVITRLDQLNWCMIQ